MYAHVSRDTNSLGRGYIYHDMSGASNEGLANKLKARLGESE